MGSNNNNNNNNMMDNKSSDMYRYNLYKNGKLGKLGVDFDIMGGELIVEYLSDLSNIVNIFLKYMFYEGYDALYYDNSSISYKGVFGFDGEMIYKHDSFQKVGYNTYHGGSFDMIKILLIKQIQIDEENSENRFMSCYCVYYTSDITINAWDRHSDYMPDINYCIVLDKDLESYYDANEDDVEKRCLSESNIDLLMLNFSKDYHLFIDLYKKIGFL